MSSPAHSGDTIRFCASSKGIRKILGIPPTFINRANTNQSVFEQATEVRYGDKNRKEHTDLQMRSFSQYLHQKQTDILGHVIRAEATDPMRTVSLQPGSNIPRTHENRRVGRPRHHLLISTYERIWKDLPQNCVLNDFKAGISNNIQDIAGRARNHTGVFAPPPAVKKEELTSSRRRPPPPFPPPYICICPTLHWHLSNSSTNNSDS